MPHRAPLLLAVLLAFAGANACQSQEKCELSLPALADKKLPSLLSYASNSDTLAFISGGQLTWHPLGAEAVVALDSTTCQRQRSSITLYGQLVPTTRTSSAGEVEILTADATAIPFYVGLYNRRIAPHAQALLSVRISSPKVVLTNRMRVGMPKADFLGLFFQHLTAEELHCLGNYRVFTNSDPVGEYIEQTFVFEGDKLKEIRMQLPEMARSEQKP